MRLNNLALPARFKATTPWFDGTNLPRPAKEKGPAFLQALE
jgi:hypothetical protein